MDVLGRDGELARIDAWLGRATDQRAPVEANLSRAYRKLGVRSRTELGRALTITKM